MNKKKSGQALVEFVLILPILIFLILGFVDFGRILSKKGSLENKIDEVATLIYKEHKTKQEVIDLIEKDSDMGEVTVDYYTDRVIIKMSDNISLVTPGLNLILDSPYTIKLERTVPYDEV